MDKRIKTWIKAWTTANKLDSWVINLDSHCLIALIRKKPEKIEALCILPRRSRTHLASSTSHSQEEAPALRMQRMVVFGSRWSLCWGGCLSTGPQQGSIQGFRNYTLWCYSDVRQNPCWCGPTAPQSCKENVKQFLIKQHKRNTHGKNSKRLAKHNGCCLCVARFKLTYWPVSFDFFFVFLVCCWMC